jgi:hypothetical protein
MGVRPKRIIIIKIIMMIIIPTVRREKSLTIRPRNGLLRFDGRGISSAFSLISEETCGRT